MNRHTHTYTPNYAKCTDKQRFSRFIRFQLFCRSINSMVKVDNEDLVGTNEIWIFSFDNCHYYYGHCHFSQLLTTYYKLKEGTKNTSTKPIVQTNFNKWWWLTIKTFRVHFSHNVHIILEWCERFFRVFLDLFARINQISWARDVKSSTGYLLQMTIERTWNEQVIIVR